MRVGVVAAAWIAVGALGTRMSVAASRPGVNSNVLTDGSIVDPLSGNAVLNGIPVEVTPA